MTTVTTDRPQVDIRNGIRALLRATVQVSVTSNQLSVTPSGFVRADGGSFIADGFVDGAELTSSGFAKSGNSGRSYIRGVSPTTLTVLQVAPNGGTALTTEAAGQTATLAVQMPVSEDLSRGFTPTPDVPWWRLTMLRNQSASQRMTLGPSPEYQEAGWADVSLFYPRDLGVTACESMGEAIKATMRVNEQFTYNDRVITLIDPVSKRASTAMLTGSFDDVWYRVPIRIPYFVRS